jgi:hypothetical protein
MGKHIGTRARTNWRFELRYYRYRIHFYLGRIVKAYITRGRS